MEIDYDKIIERCEKLLKEKYEAHDSMRWPYLCGMLQAELRSVCNVLKLQEEHIKELKLIGQFLDKH